MKRDLVKAAIIEIEKALESHADLLVTENKRTLSVKVSNTRIEGGYRIAGTCTANGKKHFSFGTIVTNNPEEL